MEKKKFTVEALEKFLVKTTYRDVEASDKFEAVELCRQGFVSYDDKTIEEGDDEWVETLSVEEQSESC